MLSMRLMSSTAGSTANWSQLSNRRRNLLEIGRIPALTLRCETLPGKRSANCGRGSTHWQEPLGPEWGSE